MVDVKETLAEKAIEITGLVITVVVIAAVALAVIGGTLIDFVHALL